MYLAEVYENFRLQLYMCHLEGEWARQGMVVGASRTLCIKNAPPPKGHPANLTQPWDALESSWANMLSTYCRVYALTN
jgi:hypothetical protein